jgi:phage tail-like protein
MPELVPYRFEVVLSRNAGETLCRGAFSEVTGMDLTMKPKTLVEGGRNWGEIQLAGPTAFGTIVLKRGITDVADLWTWFDAVARQANYALRYDGRINVVDPDRPDRHAFSWVLTRAMPVKFKGPDLSATASQVAVEELHLVHEGITLERPS